jgi:hypothetical protein
MCGNKTVFFYEGPLEAAPEEYEMHFTRNFNNNLSCETAFAKVELDSPYYEAGRQYRVMLKNKFLYRATLIEKKTVTLDRFDEFTARLTAGCSLEDFKKEILERYGNRDEVSKMKFCLLLLCVVPNKSN